MGWYTEGRERERSWEGGVQLTVDTYDGSSEGSERGLRFILR